uniref:Uncharacterized protein n=1 Tax=Plectus sambesii TaxID=2011161 RepID=A0A914W6L2_9BILA
MESRGRIGRDVPLARRRFRGATGGRLLDGRRSSSTGGANEAPSPDDDPRSSYAPTKRSSALRATASSNVDCFTRSRSGRPPPSVDHRRHSTHTIQRLNFQIDSTAWLSPFIRRPRCSHAE